MRRRTRKIHVVVVGSAVFDIVVQADRLPREGESLLVRNLQFFHGGKGANQAVAVTRLGIKASFVGAVGRDAIGNFLIQGLKANGIGTALVKRDRERATGCAFVPVFPTGNNCIFVDPGANLGLAPRDITHAAKTIARADALSTVLEVPLETVEAALALARKAGKITVLDGGPLARLPTEILKLADIFSPNETELELLSGEKVSSRNSANNAAQKLIDRGARTVVLKLGSDGAMLVTRQGSKHFPARKVKAVDPTAAGDAFTAALTVQLASGHSIEDAIRFANCAGALATTRLGAQPSMPTRKEVEALAAHSPR